MLETFDAGSHSPELQAVPPQNDAPEQPTQTPSDSQIPPNVSPSPTGGGETNKSTHTPPDTPNWKMWLEVGALCLGLYFAHVYTGQLGAMNKQLIEMQSSGKQTDKLLWLYKQQLDQIKRQADDTNTLATQTTELAKGTRTIATQALKQTNTAVQTFEADYRPYMAVVTATNSIDPSTHIFKFGSRVSNEGHVTAKNVFFHCDVYIGEDLMDNPIPPHSGRALPPGLSADLNYSLADPIASDVIAGRKKLVSYCGVRYSWRNSKETYCEKQTFQQGKGIFIDNGEECSPVAHPEMNR